MKHILQQKLLKHTKIQNIPHGHPDGTAHGGIAILMKRTIEKHELLKYGEDSIPGRSINVQGFPYEINVTAVYCPHQHNQNREHFEAFFRRQVPIFIAGNDYNSKHTLWGSQLTTTEGRELSTAIQEKNY